MRFLGRIVIVFTLFFAVMLTSSQIFAAEPLTGKRIESFIASMDEIQKWSEKNEHRFKDQEKDDSPFDLTVDKIITDMRSAKAYDEVEGIVEKYGFKSPEAWADTMVRVTKAMMAGVMNSMEGVQAQMQAQMAQMMADPNIPPETKKMMQENMAHSMAFAKQSANADPADVAAVKPYLEKLQSKMMDGEK